MSHCHSFRDLDPQRKIQFSSYQVPHQEGNALAPCPSVISSTTFLWKKDYHLKQRFCAVYGHGLCNSEPRLPKLLTNMENLPGQLQNFPPPPVGGQQNWWRGQDTLLILSCINTLNSNWTGLKALLNFHTYCIIHPTQFGHKLGEKHDCHKDSSC